MSSIRTLPRWRQALPGSSHAWFSRSLCWRPAGAVTRGRKGGRAGGETIAEMEMQLRVLGEQLNVAAAQELTAEDSGKNNDFKYSQATRAVQSKYDALEQQIKDAKSIERFNQELARNADEKKQLEYNKYKEWNDYMAAKAEVREARA